MTFQEFINGRIFPSLSLYHSEEEVEEFTLSDFGLESLTAYGAIYWIDVLEAEVVMFLDNSDKNGIVSIWVKGVAAERVEDFQASHAGYCSEKDWDTWFQMVE